MKTFFVALLGVIVLGWFLIGLFAALFGEGGLLLLVAVVIAALIALIASQFEEIDNLSKRVKALEEAAETGDLARED